MHGVAQRIEHTGVVSGMGDQSSIYLILESHDSAKAPWRHERLMDAHAMVTLTTASRPSPRVVTCMRASECRMRGGLGPASPGDVRKRIVGKICMYAPDRSGLPSTFYPALSPEAICRTEACRLCVLPAAPVEGHICQALRSWHGRQRLLRRVVKIQNQIYGRLIPPFPLTTASVLILWATPCIPCWPEKNCRKTVAVIGCGPMGFSVLLSRALWSERSLCAGNQRSSPKLAKEMKADYVSRSANEDVYKKVMEVTKRLAWTLCWRFPETGCHPLGFKILRLGGRASLLGIPSKPMEANLADDIISKARSSRVSTDA